MLTNAEPRAPLTLTNLRSGASWRLAWPSPLRGGTHIAAVHPTAATSPLGSTAWPLRVRKATTCGCAADIVAKATDMAWTGDGRLVVLTGTAARGWVVAVWRPGQPRLALRQFKLPKPSPGTDTLAIW